MNNMFKYVKDAYMYILKCAFRIAVLYVSFGKLHTFYLVANFHVAVQKGVPKQ